MARKIRSDSRLDRLPPDQLARLDGWLFEENLKFAEVKTRLASEFGVSSSLSALCSWRQRRAQERLLSRIADGARTARAIQDQFASHEAAKGAKGEESYPALMALIGQMALQLHIEGGERPDMATLMDLADLASLGMKARHDAAKLELDRQKIGLDERRVKLLEEKAKQAEDAEAVTKDVNLTPEERQAKYREIFGLPA